MFPLYPRSAPESSEGALTEGEVLVIVFLCVTPLRGAGGWVAAARGDAWGGDTLPTAVPHSHGMCRAGRLLLEALILGGISNKPFQKTFFAPFFFFF